MKVLKIQRLINGSEMRSTPDTRAGAIAPRKPPSTAWLSPIGPLAVVTGVLARLPDRVTDPRCGTLVSPSAVVTGVLAGLPDRVTDPRCGTLVSPSAVVTGVLAGLRDRTTDPRCGTLTSPTTPPSATNPDRVTATPRVILAQCSHRAAAVIERPPLIHKLCSSKTARSASVSFRPNTLWRSRIAGFRALTSEWPPTASGSVLTTLTSLCQTLAPCANIALYNTSESFFGKPVLSPT